MCLSLSIGAIVEGLFDCSFFVFCFFVAFSFTSFGWNENGTNGLTGTVAWRRVGFFCVPCIGPFFFSPSIWLFEYFLLFV